MLQNLTTIYFQLLVDCSKIIILPPFFHNHLADKTHPHIQGMYVNVPFSKARGSKVENYGVSVNKL